LTNAQLSLGEVGLPEPLSQIARRTWDVVVVGGGHNGLCASAYIARAGLSVLVLERRPRIGGACTLEQPFDDKGFLVSPCAYLVGLLHPLVVEELGLRSRGFRVKLVDPHLWCPFEDGTSIALWDDETKSAEAVRELSSSDVDGYLSYCALFSRLREALRSGTRDAWVGDAPDRDEIEALLGHDPEAIEVVFERSIADVVERHVADQRLRTALHGQGIIGTFAGPRDSGTASIHLMHSSGTIDGRSGAWGYVEGGMGRVSFAIADAASEAGAVIASGVDVSKIVPGLGVELEGGELIRARAVVSNADPKSTLSMCDGEVPASFRDKVETWRCESPVLKINCALSRLPRFSARAPSISGGPHRAMVTISGGIDETQAAYEAARLGEPSPAWCELYFQSAYDPTVAPAGHHVMSVFAQYVPYRPATGDWGHWRDVAADAAIESIAKFAPDVAETIIHREVLAPPDVERRVGSTGGHIFHGECLPEQMWWRRMTPRTPVDGLYLCGASTHPGDSVIAVNGRNAAIAVIEDLERSAAS